MQCPACRAPTVASRRYTVVEYLLGTGDVFHYEPCGACGASTITDPPADLARYYPPSYGRFIGRRATFASLRRSLGWDDRWRAVRRVRPATSARVLDVGCGSGDFLRTLRARGFHTLTGVDPFLPFDSHADAVCRFVKGDITELRGEYFDLITMHHVIEHAPDTQRLLRDAAAVLAPDGVVLVRTPLLDSWAAQVYGALWVQHDAPRHLVLLTSAAVRSAAAAAGLRVAESWRDEGRWQAWAGATLAAGRNPFRAQGIGARLARLRYAAGARRRNRDAAGDSGCFVLRHALRTRSEHARD